MKKILDLLKAYGFGIDFTDTKQKKVRLQNEETFIDVWDSKKGITVGLYNPRTKTVKYERRVNCEVLEKLIIKNK